MQSTSIMAQETMTGAPVKPARPLIWLMPLYVVAMSAIDSLLGPRRQHASVPPAAVVGLIVAALLLFAAGIRLASSWQRQRQAAVHAGHLTGAAQVFISRHPRLADALMVAVGVPSNQALGWLVGLALSGALSYSLDLAFTAAYHGNSVALLIPTNLAAYTALVTTATYLNSRSTPGAESEAR